jgi:hypothetical protein
MKTLKTLTAGLLALAMASAASAVTLHITGSTAFRGATMTAVEHLMIAGGTSYKATFYSGDGSASLNGANIAILTGTISGTAVTVKAHWTGSTGGIQSVVQGIADSNWLADATLTGGNLTSITGAAATIPSLSGNTDAASVAEVTMEDSHQASTGFTAIPLTETRVGVIVFEWVINNGAPATVTNITPNQVQSLVSGVTFLSQFTGDSADSATAVYALGRNFDSGTRLSELAETGVGVFGSVQQVLATISGTVGVTGSISALSLYPAETVLGIPFEAGQSGYSSGGTVGKIMATPGSNAGTVAGDQGPGWLIAYLGRNDATAAVNHLTGGNATNTAHRLTFNGVADWTGGTSTISGGEGAAVNNTPVTEGLYSAWEYEFLAYPASIASPQKTVADAIANQIITTDASASGVALSAMHVSKPLEGGVITHN